MVTNCPVCSTRFRLDRQRLGGKRVSLRCVRCRAVFKVEIPPVKAGRAGRPLVLVAHSDHSLCATIGDVLSKDDIDYDICNDGDSALLRMEANPPHVAVLDVALPGLYAFEVVEKVRSRPGLQDVRIILLSSVYNKMAYKRTPSSLYGADDYIEKHHIPDDLVPKIHRLVVNATPANPDLSVCEENASVSPLRGDELAASQAICDKVNEDIRTAEEEETAVRQDDFAEEKAKRLARIIVSDIALYNQDKVEEGVRTGKFFEVLAEEISEGERLYKQRVAPEIAAREDYLKKAFESFVEKRKRELQL